jgi:hypothetical protein
MLGKLLSKCNGNKQYDFSSVLVIFRFFLSLLNPRKRRVLDGSEKLAKAFITFARVDQPWVQNVLHSALLENKREMWADWDDLPPSAEWTEVVQKGIEDSDVVVFVLTKESLRSPECGWDLDHAFKLGKRIVPIVPPYAAEVQLHLDQALRGTPFATELAQMSWVYFKDEQPGKDKSQPQVASSSSSSNDPNLDKTPSTLAAERGVPTDDAFKVCMKVLIREMDGENPEDLEHTRLHTLLLQAALDWERRDFDKSMLIGVGANPWQNDNELMRAQKWLAACSLGKWPKPTPLHVAYIDNSAQVMAGLRVRQIIAFCTIFISFRIRISSVLSIVFWCLHSHHHHSGGRHFLSCVGSFLLHAGVSALIRVLDIDVVMSPHL